MAGKTQGKKTKYRKKKKQNQNQTGITLVLAVLVILLIAFLGYQLRHFFHTKAVPETEPETLESTVLSASAFGSDGLFKTYNDGNVNAEIGMDVSSHNGWIDWSTVADSLDFVIIRAGYRGYADGSLQLDEYLAYNLESASQYGLGIGLYFFSQALTEEEAKDEAMMVVNAIAGYQISYPIYFDWEPVSSETSRTATISASDLTACAKAFCETVEAYGYNAGIYFNLNQASSQIDLLQLKEYDFWLAEYADTPSFPYRISSWQYTNQGSCPGVDTKVDLDLYFRESNG